MINFMSPIFKKSLDVIHEFTLSINQDTHFICPYCQKTEQFVSHGWLYKLRADGSKGKVGKRILCDKRRGGVGCGSTLRILSSNETYQLHVITMTIIKFLFAICKSFPVVQAYEKATGTSESRNAWRWWQRLKNKEGDFRRYLFSRCKRGGSDRQKESNKSLALLSQVRRLVDEKDKDLANDFQVYMQVSLL